MTCFHFVRHFDVVQRMRRIIVRTTPESTLGKSHLKPRREKSDVRGKPSNGASQDNNLIVCIIRGQILADLQTYAQTHNGYVSSSFLTISSFSPPNFQGHPHRIGLAFIGFHQRHLTSADSFPSFHSSSYCLIQSSHFVLPHRCRSTPVFHVRSRLCQSCSVVGFESGISKSNVGTG
jgi:hypothetical protein